MAEGASIIRVKKDAPGPTHDGSSWNNAYTTLQAGLAAATGGDEVWVFAEAYYPTDPTLPSMATDRTSTFELPDGVAIYGGFDNEQDTLLEHRNADPEQNNTRLSGAINTEAATDNSYRVVTASGVGGGTILDGFTIAAGYGYDASENPPGPTSGSGIFMLDSNAIIRNCIIRNCEANEGGGAAVDSSSIVSQPLFEDVQFINNLAKDRGAGLLATQSKPKVSRAYFVGNNAGVKGGGICSTDAGGLLDVRNSLFYENHAGGNGGGIWLDNDGYIDNVTVSENTAGATSTALGAGMFVHVENVEQPPQVAVRNSILWRNNPTAEPQTTNYQMYGPETLTVQFSCIEDGTIDSSIPFGGATNGNTDEDPEFLSPGNFRLALASPCINRGQTTELAALDLDREDRVKPCGVDMGAYEKTPLGGACCVDSVCSVVEAQCACVKLVCDVAEHLPSTFAGCYGDADGNGVVNAADRGSISAAIDTTDPVQICLFDMDGNGTVSVADRGFVSANIGLCTPLPSYQNGSGFNGHYYDTRFLATYLGNGSTCGESGCE